MRMENQPLYIVAPSLMYSTQEDIPVGRLF